MTYHSSQIFGNKTAIILNIYSALRLLQSAITELRTRTLLHAPTEKTFQTNN
jgi:hypothetical protein